MEANVSNSDFLTNQIASAYRQISAFNANIERAQAQNKLLDRKIEKLKVAKQHAEWAGFNADQMKQCIYQVQPGDWAGTNWDKFRDATHGGEAHQQAKYLHRDCDALRDEIQAEIDKANSRKNHFAEIISGAFDAISQLDSSIRQFSAQLKGTD